MLSPFGIDPPSSRTGPSPGGWEGDLLAGTKHSHIIRLVERHSRFVVLIKLRGRETYNLVDAFHTGKLGNCHVISHAHLPGVAA